MAVIPDREAPRFQARKQRRERAGVTKPLHGSMLTSLFKKPTEYSQNPVPQQTIYKLLCDCSLKF